MTTLYLLAHFDDEYFAYPLIREAARAGEAMRFVYACGYPTPGMTERRRQESLALLSRLGVAAEDVVLLPGAAPDGALHAHLEAVMAALRQVAAEMGAIDRIVVSAWEGGHADHDCCAAMAVVLAAELGGLRVDQVALYSGRGLASPWFRAGVPLPENGAVRRVRMSASGWIAFALAVRFFPSQWRTWAGLWPAMWLSYLRWGYGVQSLAAARIGERPHAGPLLYERRFKTGYDEVQARVGAMTRKPASIRA